MTSRIDVGRFGLAWGATAALLYVGCIFVTAVAGKEGSIFFFNSIMHGVDIEPILRMDMPAWEMLVGVVEIFILAWLTGAAIAAVYNLSLRIGRRHE